MRTFFHKDTGKYLGNVADDRAPDDKTLPKSHRDQIAIEGEWNGDYKLDLQKMEVVALTEDEKPKAPKTLEQKLVELSARVAALEAKDMDRL